VPLLIYRPYVIIYYKTTRVLKKIFRLGGYFFYEKIIIVIFIYKNYFIMISFSTK